eukprot:9476273-Pyramimonas_sp.AAC.1
MSWHWAQGSPPPWAQGGLAHRSRENALLCLQAVQWRAGEAGVSIVHANYDCSNAFASTKRALLRATAWKYATEADQPFALGASANTQLSMQCADEWLYAETTVGAQMGCTLCPRQFNDVYNSYVDQWVQGERERGAHQIWHDTVHPITGTKRDLALNTFMDDITRAHA